MNTYLALLLGGLEDTGELETFFAVLGLLGTTSAVALWLVCPVLPHKVILICSVTILLLQRVSLANSAGTSQSPDCLEAVLGLVPPNNVGDLRVTLSVSQDY